jgi:hypothetical protein
MVNITYALATLGKPMQTHIIGGFSCPEASVPARISPGCARVLMDTQSNFWQYPPAY